MGNTTLAASVGGLTVLLLRLIMHKRYDIGGMCNGILAGLVSITAGCGNVDCGWAVFIGVFGGLVFQAASSLLKTLKIDDPIDAFAVHGACGIWGVLAAAIFDWGRAFDYVHAGQGFRCLKDPETKLCNPPGDGMGQSLFGANVLE